MHNVRALPFLVGFLGLVSLGAIAATPQSPAGMTLHYSPNDNFAATGEFLPSKAGFDLADLSDPGRMEALPRNVKVLVWVGQCDGVSDKFIAAVTPFLESPRVFGYYLMDDPDPRLGPHLTPACLPESLRAESDWLHEHAPGVKTIIVLMNLGNARTPSYKSSYNPQNSHVDLYGLSAYPCRTTFRGCDWALIDRYVRASDAAGIPRNQLVPVYQSFGGGEWKDEWGGSYLMPNAAEEAIIIRQWHKLVPHPVLDMAYSWGVQRSDTSLQNDSRLKRVFAIFNGARSVFSRGTIGDGMARTGLADERPPQ